MSQSIGRDLTSDLEAHEALKTILSDQETFKQVVDTGEGWKVPNLHGPLGRWDAPVSPCHEHTRLEDERRAPWHDLGNHSAMEGRAHSSTSSHHQRASTVYGPDQVVPRMLCTKSQGSMYQLPHAGRALPRSPSAHNGARGRVPGAIQQVAQVLGHKCGEGAALSAHLNATHPTHLGILH